MGLRVVGGGENVNTETNQGEIRALGNSIPNWMPSFPRLAVPKAESTVGAWRGTWKTEYSSRS